MAKYQIVYEKSTGVKVELEKAYNIAWERYENRPGSCRFTLAHNDSKIVNLSLGIGKVNIYRDNALVWRGILDDCEERPNQAVFYGSTLLEVLKWYSVGQALYSSKKIGSEIIDPIWDAIAAKTNSALGTLVTLGTIEDPYQTGNSTAKTIDHQTFDEDFYTLVNHFMQVARADSPSGAWVQNAVYEVTLADVFNFWRNKGADKPEVIFEYGSEILDYVQLSTSRSIRNSVKGATIGENPQLLTSTQTDSASQVSYKLREITLPLTTTTNQTELNEGAKNYLKEHKDPQTQLGLVFKAGLKPFDGYDLGDNVKIKIKRGSLDINEYRRVVGMEVTVADTGVEQVTPILVKQRS